MKKNLIILTHGWTGSSVFSALLGEAGYWTGDKTVIKTDYNTYENMGLVELNKQMLKDLGFEDDHEHVFTYESVMQLSEKAKDIDLTPYKNFIDSCNQNSPWVWKDPRLTWTIRIWARVLPMNEISFMILTRDDFQAWVSSNLRRHIQSMRFTKKYNHSITKSNIDFLNENELQFINFSFENLILNPEETLLEINKFMDLSLTMEDLKKTYNQPLYKKSRNIKDFLLACLIYFKNYRERSV